MNYKIKKTALLVSFLVSIFFVGLMGAHIAHAGCTVIDPANPNGTYCLLAPIPGLTSSTDGSIDVTNGFGDYINRIIRIFIGLLSVMAVIMIVFGGIQYMISDVAGEKSAGKDRIMNAIWGLVLALASYMLLNTINPDFVHLGIHIPAGTLTDYSTSDQYSEAETQDGQDYPPVSGGTTQALCTDYTSCKALCTSTSNGSNYNGTPHAPGVLDPSLAQPIAGIPLVTGGCQNCSASAGVINALNQIKPTVDSLIASGSIPNKSYTFQITSAYRPVKDQIRLMCANGDTSINQTVVSHTIAYPGTSKHGIGLAVDVAFFWDGTQVTNCGATRATGVIEKIMDGAGFARLNKEAWHFEIDTTNPLTCTGSSCGEPTKCSP